MSFESRSFWHPKDTQHPAEYEDAYCLGVNGTVAIADGVSQGIFCRHWADLLTRAAAAEPPDVSTPEALTAWLESSRAAWRGSIDLNSLTWSQRMKLQQVGGAYSTLLWASVEPLPAEEAETPARFRVASSAVGDCSLFIVRGGELLRKFPLANVADFEADPVTIGSVFRNKDGGLEFQSSEEICQEGDLVVLCTDALGKWIYQTLEAGESVDWDRLWNLSPDDWHALVAELRALPEGQRMRVDDTTLVMLRLTMTPPVVEPVQENSADLEPAVDEEEERGDIDLTLVAPEEIDETLPAEDHPTPSVAPDELEPGTVEFARERKVSPPSVAPDQEPGVMDGLKIIASSILRYLKR
jgi:hypothetical protein